MNASPALFLDKFSFLLFAVNYMNIIIKEGRKHLIFLLPFFFPFWVFWCFCFVLFIVLGFFLVFWFCFVMKNTVLSP